MHIIRTSLLAILIAFVSIASAQTKVDLTKQVKGVLPLANGGTNNTSGTATVNANLTGPITSSGNATAIAAQTGTGTTFVTQAGPTFTGTDTGVQRTATTAFSGPVAACSATAFNFGTAGTGLCGTSTAVNVGLSGTSTFGFQTNGFFIFSNTVPIVLGSGFDTGVSRCAGGETCFGTGAQGAVDGTVTALRHRMGTKSYAIGTAPTIASGGCTSPSVTNTNGTAYITIAVGTGCSGSQPVIFTLPAATTGWNCYGRNVSNAATSSPRQTGAVSTTSVTITNFAETTGLAAAWTDNDVVIISCLGG